MHHPSLGERPRSSHAAWTLTGSGEWVTLNHCPYMGLNAACTENSQVCSPATNTFNCGLRYPLMASEPARKLR